MSSRFSSQDLQAARRRKQLEREEMQRQESQEAANQQRRDQEERQRYEGLTTVAQSLYDELDKLTKKAPKETLSNLTLDRVNDLIRETKNFLADDSYLKGIITFEAAGDNPEYRDALLIIGQLRAAIQRFRASKRFDWSQFR